MSKQRIFNYVVKHLVQQGRRSAVKNTWSFKGTCLYRGPNGTMCAVGCLIKDKDFDPQFNADSVDGLFCHNQYPHLKLKFGAEKELELLMSLQACHDGATTVNQVRKFLKDTAEKFGLDDSKVELIKKWR